MYFVGGKKKALILEPGIPEFKVLVLLISLCVWEMLVKFPEPQLLNQKNRINTSSLECYLRFGESVGKVAIE